MCAVRQRDKCQDATGWRYLEHGYARRRCHNEIPAVVSSICSHLFNESLYELDFDSLDPLLLSDKEQVEQLLELQLEHKHTVH
jgi:hypothetical protein